MRETSLNFRNQILSDDRKLCMKVVFNGRQEIDGHYLKSVTIHEVSNGQDTLTMGSICSNSVKIVMVDGLDIAYMNSEVEVFIGLDLEPIEWVSMGVFVVSEVNKENGHEIVLEGYDHILDLNRDYVPCVDFPCLLEDVVNDIVGQCELTLKSMIFDEIMIDYPLEVSCKEMLGYMASLMGMNVRMNRDNQLEFFWYEGCYVIDEKDIFEGCYKRVNDVLVISSLISGTEDQVISCGSGYGISFVNPYMNEDILNTIYERINGLTYCPCQIQWRGNPAIEVCDVLEVDGENVIIMDNVMTFDGGMKCSIECVGQGEKEVAMSYSPTEIKLKKLYQTLIQSFKETTEKILGHKGGYYTIDYTDGYPSGWTIMNTPTLREDTHLWKMSMGGFGYSEDGGRTFKNYAFDLEGHLNANVLTTGVIQGDCFELDLENGDICIGERNNEGMIDHPVLSYSSTQGLHIEAFSQIESQLTTLMNSIHTSILMNYVNSQTYDQPQNAYYPDYTSQPLRLTAITKDSLKNDCVHALYQWKRKGQSDNDYYELIDGEVANGNVLMISHNLEESVEYKVYVSVTLDNGIVLNDEASMNINMNVLNDVMVNGEMCTIEANGTAFIEHEGNYNYSHIVLSPHFMQCDFDLWLYSTDLGNVYTIIEIGKVITQESQIYSTNVDGVTFCANNNELIISPQCSCFDTSNAIVFQLKANVEQATDTIVITRESDVAIKVNTIISEINQLSHQYTNISYEIDSLNSSITNQVENIETQYNNNIENISKQLSTVIQTASKIEEQYQSLKETVDEKGSQIETITTYIRKTANGIEVGELEANVKTLMGTSYFAILFNNEEVMKLEQSLLTIERIKTLKNFQLGHAILTSKEYGFDITWGGE